MKNIFKYIALASVALAAVACGKAEYKTTNFVSFNSKRVSIPEACGTYKIPVVLYNAKEAVITYKVTEGSAKKGDDYVIVDKNGNIDDSGVLSITDGSDTIYVKVTDKTGILTKNLTFNIDILASATEGVVLGSTTDLICTILDSDAGINLLAGDWSGVGEDSDGADASLAFSIRILDEESEEGKEILEFYPNCNLIFEDLDVNDGDMDGAIDLYGFYEENTGKVHIYADQPFNAYNFTGLGPAFVGFGPEGMGKGDITFTTGDGDMVLDGRILIYLYNYDEEWEPGIPVTHMGSYYYTDFLSGLELTKSE